MDNCTIQAWINDVQNAFTTSTTAALLCDENMPSPTKRQRVSDDSNLGTTEESIQIRRQLVYRHNLAELVHSQKAILFLLFSRIPSVLHDRNRHTMPNSQAAPRSQSLSDFL